MLCPIPILIAGCHLCAALSPSDSRLQAQQRKPRKTAGTYDRDDYWFDDVTVHEFSSSPQSKRSHKKKAGKEFERPRYKHASPASQGRPLTAPVNMPKVFDWFQCNACNLFLPLVPPYPATPRRCSRCIAEGTLLFDSALSSLPPLFLAPRSLSPSLRLQRRQSHSCAQCIVSPLS